MTIGRYMAEVTRKQHRSHLAWLDAEENRPSLTDHYLMAINANILRISGKEVKHLDEMKIKFDRQGRAKKTTFAGQPGPPIVTDEMVAKDKIREWKARRRKGGPRD